MKSSIMKLLLLVLTVSAIACRKDTASLNPMDINDALDALKKLENALSNTSIPLSSCQAEIFQAIRHPSSKLHMLMNSGKGINDLGNYEACNTDTSTKYVTATIGLKGANSFYSFKLGICGPSTCKLDDYYGMVNHYGVKISESFGFMGFNMLSFNFYMPSDTKSDQLDTSAIAFITVTFILFGIGLAGTSVDLFQSFWKEHRQKKIDERNKRIKSKYLSSGQYSTLVLTDDERGTSANELLLDDDEKTRLSNEKKANERTPKSLEFLAAFSYSTNFKKIFSNLSQPANPRLDILNGIRCISMVWVLYGHTFYYFIYTPIMNPLEPLNMIKSFWWQALLQAPFSVDSFFLLAGFLSAYGFIGELKKRKGRINIPILYLHRYLRIIPLYAFVFFGYWALVRYLNSGPVWPDLQRNLVDYQCPDYWWTNMLFINNIVPWNDPAGCFGWSWYLANDFQFFLITPFILLAYYKNRKIGWAVIILTLVGSFSATIAISVINQFPVNFMELQPVYLTYYRDLYSKPWTRISPYLIGIIMAYTYLEHREESDNASSYIKIVRKGVSNKFVRFIMYGLGITLTSLMVFLPYDANKEPGHWSPAGSAVYYSLGRSLFALGIVLLIYPCLQGHFNILYKILGATFWTPIARITFGVYLVHPILMQVMYYGTLQGTYFSTLQMNYFFFANLFISLIAGLLLTLFIESPFMNIHKNFLFKGREAAPKKKEITPPQSNNLITDENKEVAKGL